MGGLSISLRSTGPDICDLRMVLFFLTVVCALRVP